MNVHAEKRRGELQRVQASEQGRFDVTNAAAFAKHLCHCPICGNPEPRIYRTSVRSLTVQCGRCKLQWTMTWRMLARAFDRYVADTVSFDTANVTRAVFGRLSEIEARGRKNVGPPTDHNTAALGKNGVVTR